MSQLGYSAILSSDSITVTIDGKAHVVEASAPNYAPLWDAIGKRADAEMIRSLVVIQRSVEFLTSGLFRFSDTGEVLYGDKPAPDYAATVLIDAVNRDQDVRPLCRFFEKAFANPQEGMVHELFDYFKNQGCKITPDGDILALKIVRDDYLDHHSRTVSYAVGTTVEMDRGACDTNRGRDCSSGLHFCGPGYVHTFGGANSRVVYAKINPTDVTSIPNYAGYSKARCCRMEIIAEVPTRRGQGGASTFARHLDDMMTKLYEGHVDTSAAPVTKRVPVKSTARAAETGDDMPVLSHGKHKLTLAFLRTEIERIGQRGVNRDYGIPRSTLQGFLKKHADYVVKAPPKAAPKAAPKTSVPVVPRKAAPPAAPVPPAPPPKAKKPEPPPTTRAPTPGAGLKTAPQERKLSSAEKAMLAKAEAAKTAETKKKPQMASAVVGKGFAHAGKSYAEGFVRNEVAKLGQRGFSDQYGVPRSTLQGWLKQINAQAPAAPAPTPKPAPAPKKPAPASKEVAEKLPKPRAAKAAPKAPEKTFTNRGATFTESYIKERVAAVGQRGAAREMDVPRTTLQLWLKEIG